MGKKSRRKNDRSQASGSSDHESSAELGDRERRILKWVDPHFQRRYAARLLSLVLLGASVLLGVFWFHSQKLLEILVALGMTEGTRGYLLIENQMVTMFWGLCFVVIVIGAIAFIVSNFFSQSLIGPIFAIRRSLELMARGDFTGARIQLREGDEFRELAQMINLAIDHHELTGHEHPHAKTLKAHQ